MFQVKFNEQHKEIFNTVFGVGLVLIGCFIASLPAYAGAQSLLDPYADISPTNAKSESKSPIKKMIKHATKQKESNAERSASTNDTVNELSQTAVSKPSKSKEIKVSQNKASESKVISKTNDKPGFVDGIKEIKHGYVTSFKAAGSGIVTGSKAAGAKMKVAGGGIVSGSKVAGAKMKVAGGGIVSGSKVAGAKMKVAGGKIVAGSKVAGAKIVAGTKSLRNGIASASNKVFSRSKSLVAKTNPAPKAQKTQTLANAGTMSAGSRFPVLPGKPLDQSLADEKERKRLKDAPVTGETVKPSRVASTFNKLNVFHKPRKTAPTNVAVNNLNTARTN